MNLEERLRIIDRLSFPDLKGYIMHNEKNQKVSLQMNRTLKQYKSMNRPEYVTDMAKMFALFVQTGYNKQIVGQVQKVINSAISFHTSKQYEAFKNPVIYNALALYEKRKANYLILENILGYNQAEEFAREVCDERILNALGDKKSVNECIINTVYYQSVESAVETSKTLEIYKNDKNIIQILEIGLEKYFEYEGKIEQSDYMTFIHVLNRYSDNNYIKLCKIFIELFEENEEMDLEELLVDENYDRIKSSEDPKILFRNILMNQYTEIRKNIHNIGFDDVRLVRKTLDLVMAIHTDRDVKQKNDIKNGFFDELKRAMAQGDRIRYLRRYCDEVQEQMKNNVEDLMVVHNES